MAASYPKPDGERRNRVPPKFDWTNLPAEGRKGGPPPMPEWRLWHQKTVEWWARMWAKPQAVAWDQTGTTLHPLLLLYDDVIGGRVDTAKASPEIRQHEDRHGLNPKAMLQLRWRIVGDEVAEARQTPKAKRLRAVEA